MRIFAIIFSLIGFYELLRLIDVTLAPLVPLHLTGPEAGLIAAAYALVIGITTSLVGVVFAFVDFWRERRSKSPKFLLVWCALVFVGFPIVFVLMAFK